MKKKDRSEQILLDARRVSMRVNTLKNEIAYNIEKTKQEIKDREKKAKHKV